MRDALSAMARDARGNPSDATPTPTPGAKNKKDKGDGRVTYTVKGEKQVVIEIAALKGKGYPAPVNPSPAAPQPKAPAAKKKPSA